MERILSGPKGDAVMGLAWHPTSNMVASVSSTGRVYL
jgi:hypothetical protein